MVRKRKKPSNKLNVFMAVFITVIMVGSIMGLMMNNPEEKIVYNGHTFKEKGNYLTLKLDGERFNFYYSPQDVENIEMPIEVHNFLQIVPTSYVVFDPDAKFIDYMDFSRFELSEEMLKLDKIIQGGITKQSEFYNLPVINCDNATQYVPVIYFKNSNTTKFYMEGNCIIAKSNTAYGFLALKDRIIYSLLGIIE